MNNAQASPSAVQVSGQDEEHIAIPGFGTIRRDLFAQSQSVHFRPTRPFHMPEDFPWKDALQARAVPVLITGLVPAADAADKGSSLTGRERLAAAQELLQRYRELGREPIVCVLRKPGCRSGKAGLLRKLSCAGARVHLVPAAKGEGAARRLWQSVHSLTSEPVLLHPVDVPHTRRSTLMLLLQRLAQHAETPFAPQWQHVCGWPLVLGRRELAGLADGSLLFADVCRQAATASAGAVDILSCAAHGVRTIRTVRTISGDMLLPDEALALLRSAGCSQRGLAHAMAAGHVAAALAWRYHLQGAPLQPEFACAAGYLHDIAKGFKHHEKTGAQLLELLGLEGMARCIRDHRDLVLADDCPVTERELVYLADKYCFGPRFVPLQERFGQKMVLFAANAAAVAGIQKRLAHAKDLEARITREIGISPEEIARHTLS